MTRRPLGDQIRTLRTGRGMTQARLAELAGVTWSFIAKVEAGNRLPSMDTLERLAKLKPAFRPGGRRLPIQRAGS